MIRVLMVIALVLVACDGTPAPSGKSPAAGASAARFTPEPTAPVPTASPSPVHLAGSSVQVVINGVELQPGAEAVLSDDGPTTVVLTFPVPMDRASVEAFLPRSFATSWLSDRALSLVIPVTESSPSFKIPQARSADGGTVLDLFVLNLSQGATKVASVFSVAELLAGAQAPKAGAPRLTIGRSAFAVPSPDGTKLLVSMFSATTGLTARVIDIGTRASSPLALPSTPQTAPPRVVAGWAGNDRVVSVADHVWVTAATGGAPRAVADLGAFGSVSGVAVSPNGTYVAVASQDHLAVVDLATGGTRALAGHQAECQIQTGPLTTIAWSKDEKRIAVVECVATPGSPIRTRVIDVSADRTVAAVEGGIFGAPQLLTGEFAVSRDSGVYGAGAPTLWVVFSFDGVERTRFLSRGPALSPDGRYNIEPGCCAGEGFALRDLVDPSQPARGTQGSAQWLRDGRVLVLTR